MTSLTLIKKILVVSTLTAEIQQIMLDLERAGFDSVLAESVVVACRKIVCAEEHNIPFDLIVTAASDREVDAVELLRLIQEGKRRIFVVGLCSERTANFFKGTPPYWLDDFCPKPITIEKIMKKISVLNLLRYRNFKLHKRAISQSL